MQAGWLGGCRCHGFGVFDEAVPMVERRWNAGEVAPEKQHGHVEDSGAMALGFAWLWVC